MYRSFGVLFDFATFLLFFSLGGNWLDQKFGCDPVLTIIGLILGLAIGFYRIFTNMKD